MLVVNGRKSQRPIVTIIVVLLNIDTVPHPYYHNCYQHHQHRLSISVSIIIVIVIIIIVIIIIITVIVTIIVILNNIWGRRWCNTIL
jgi:ABC-type multidrug transport system permease subunit